MCCFSRPPDTQLARLANKQNNNAKPFASGVCLGRGMRGKMNNVYLPGVGEDSNCLAWSRSLQGLKMTEILVEER